MAKVILDCELMKHPHSGLYYYCLNLGNSVQKILEQENSGWNMKYYVPSAEQNSFRRPLNCIVENKKLHKIVKPFLWDCDIWHAPFQSGRMVPQRKKNSRLKIVLTVHDLNALHEGKTPEFQKRSIAQTQTLIDQADAIICISEFAKADVLAHCEVGNKPVHAIHNGIHVVDIEDHNMKSFKPHRPFLFGIGYVNAKKNYHVLLPLLKYNADIEMVISGRLDEPDYIATMKQTAIEWGISDRLHITGPISDAEKAWYMRHCLAFMHPSLAEGFGLPVVEAMQFGVPLFLSDKTSLPEIGKDVAFYFRNFEHDHMLEVFNSGIKLFRETDLKERIMKRGGDFNWENSARQYVDVYHSLL
ncbi:MAG: glycosyltransferase family 1 protein [Ginsengibacter sp.]